MPASRQRSRSRLVALAVTDPKRNALVPDLPTMSEAGVPGFESVIWFGFSVPAATQRPIIDKLARAANEALRSDDVVKSFTAQFVSTIGGSPEDFRAYIDSENKRWSTVVASAGLARK